MNARFRMKYSIAALMLLVVACASSFAALTHPSIWWASGLYSFTVFFLAISTVLAIVHRGRARSWWLGVAIAGWVHFVLVFDLRGIHQASPWPGPGISGGSSIMAMEGPTHGVTAPPLVHKGLIDRLQPAETSVNRPLRRDQALFFNLGPQGESFETALGVGIMGAPPMRYYNLLNFRRIGESLAILLLACLGGLVGALFHPAPAASNTEGSGPSEITHSAESRPNS